MNIRPNKTSDTTSSQQANLRDINMDKNENETNDIPEDKAPLTADQASNDSNNDPENISQCFCYPHDVSTPQQGCTSRSMPRSDGPSEENNGRDIPTIDISNMPIKKASQDFDNTTSMTEYIERYDYMSNTQAASRCKRSSSGSRLDNISTEITPQPFKNESNKSVDGSSKNTIKNNSNNSENGIQLNDSFERYNHISSSDYSDSESSISTTDESYRSSPVTSSDDSDNFREYKSQSDEGAEGSLTPTTSPSGDSSSNSMESIPNSSYDSTAGSDDVMIIGNMDYDSSSSDEEYVDGSWMLENSWDTGSPSRSAGSVGSNNAKASTSSIASLSSVEATPNSSKANSAESNPDSGSVAEEILTEREKLTDSTRRSGVVRGAQDVEPPTQTDTVVQQESKLEEGPFCPPTQSDTVIQQESERGEPFCPICGFGGPCWCIRAYEKTPDSN